MSRSGASIVRKEDRLFSLILALLASRDGLTKNDILSTIRGYSEVYDHKVNKSLEKMFERDKAELRSMGVVIDTIEPFGEEGETHNIRYKITHRNFELPSDFTFTPEELTLLNIAAQAWRQGSLSSDSRHALTKIKSLGIEADNSIIGLAPVITTYDRCFDVVSNALHNELILTFSYLKPGQSQPQLRTAAPLAIVQWNGYWHMLGFDMDAQSQRTFLLRRIVGEISHLTQQTFEREPANYAQNLLNELAALSEANVARIQTAEESDVYLRLLSQGARTLGDGLVEINYTDEDLFADFLIPFGASAEVISPETLRSKVRERFEYILRKVGK